mgnify:CR=1 FL=1
MENVQESTCLNGKNSADTVAMYEKTPFYWSFALTVEELVSIWKKKNIYIYIYSEVKAQFLASTPIPAALPRLMIR